MLFTTLSFACSLFFPLLPSFFRACDTIPLVVFVQVVVLSHAMQTSKQVRATSNGNTRDGYPQPTPRNQTGNQKKNKIKKANNAQTCPGPKKSYHNAM